MSGKDESAEKIRKKTKNERTRNRKDLSKNEDGNNIPGSSESSPAQADSPSSEDAETDPKDQKQNAGNSNSKKAYLMKKQEKALRDAQLVEVEALLKKPFVDNNFPKETQSCVLRKYLQVDPHGSKAVRTTGRFSSDIEKKCCFCWKKKDLDGNTELIKCHGQISGELNVKSKIKPSPRLPFDSRPRRPCLSRFHFKCATMYNAGGFQFQYAAQLECQAKLLCPLHCCVSCDLNHCKQSAYEDELIECALCLRAFHLYGCYPAGARDLDIILNAGTPEEIRYEMMICPSHDAPAVLKNSRKTKKHINACFTKVCQKPSSSLIECSTCIRSFHVECREVEMINGEPVPQDQCEMCICGDEIPLDAPVLVRWGSKNELWLARTISWYQFPKKHRGTSENFEHVGYTAVKWISDHGRNEMSIVPVSDVVELVPEYLQFAAPNVKKLWETTLVEYGDNGLDRCPPVVKLVYGNMKTSKHMQNFTKYDRLEDMDLCKCEGPERCNTHDCPFFSDNYECPPACGKKKGKCMNRKISEGIPNEKLDLRETENKGYGVFAKEKILKGEFLSEYVGEIITKDEKDRRRNIISTVNDFQANHYMMDISNNLTVDAARYGNISRYINHSCDPNSICHTTSVYVRTDRKVKLYDQRPYLMAMRDIEKDEEVTFSYQMGNEENLPVCMCGADICDGSMSGSKKRKKSVKKEKSEDTESESASETPEKNLKEVQEKSKSTGKKKTFKRKTDNDDVGPTPPKRQLKSSDQHVRASSFRTPLAPAQSSSKTRCYSVPTKKQADPESSSSENNPIRNRIPRNEPKTDS